MGIVLVISSNEANSSVSEWIELPVGSVAVYIVNLSLNTSDQSRPSHGGRGKAAVNLEGEVSSLGVRAAFLDSELEVHLRDLGICLHSELTNRVEGSSRATVRDCIGITAIIVVLVKGEGWAGAVLSFKDGESCASPNCRIRVDILSHAICSHADVLLRNRGYAPARVSTTREVDDCKGFIARALSIEAVVERLAPEVQVF